MRLDKMLAHLGYGSRKEVKEFIRKGCVMVNGAIVVDDDFKVDETLDEVTFLGKELHYEHYRYFLLNKPAGYVSATYDSYDPTVIDLISHHENKDLFPVGRLDKDTTGLLLITNDGKLAHNLLVPNKHVDKIYELTFTGEFKEEYFQRFTEGILLEDGYRCKPASFKLIEKNQGLITIQEGKYHQVKRMMNALDMEVQTLKRISFGKLQLPQDLKEGEYIELSKEQIQQIFS